MESATELNFALGETTDLLRDSIREFASPVNYGGKWETWACSVSR